jgi:O-antigen ligase
MSLKWPMKTILFCLLVLGSMVGGFRASLIFFLILFALLFYLEGMMRSRALPVLALTAIALAVVVVPFADRLPRTLQRSLSFLPIKVDPDVMLDAQASTEWRLGIWRSVVPQIPEYLLLGKGYSISSKELALARMNTAAGAGSAEGAELVADYHNGPLSVIVPLGLPGAIVFLWFLAVAMRTMHQNYLYGDPKLKMINRFLFAYFICRVVIFFVIFGNFYTDIGVFLGLVGLSVSFNGGLARPVAVEQAKFVFDRFRVHPGARKPVNA